LTLNKLQYTLITVKRFVKENWGAPFIVGFMFLLIGAAVLPSISSELVDLANITAVWAFFALVAGVVLQFVSFLKYPHIDDSEVI
jgi:uncharacterized membrane protein